MIRILMVAFLAWLIVGCAPVHRIVYMVPQLEFADGEVPQMLAFPTASVKECEALGHQFDNDVGADPTVLSHAWSCITSKMQLKKPTMRAPEDAAPLAKKNST